MMIKFYWHLVVAPQSVDTTATTGENQQVEDPPSSRFTWLIENFSRMTVKKLYSDSFVVGGFKWYCDLFTFF